MAKDGQHNSEDVLHCYSKGKHHSRNGDRQMGEQRPQRSKKRMISSVAAHIGSELLNASSKVEKSTSLPVMM